MALAALIVGGKVVAARGFQVPKRASELRYWWRAAYDALGSSMEGMCVYRLDPPVAGADGVEVSMDPLWIWWKWQVRGVGQVELKIDRKRSF